MLGRREMLQRDTRDNPNIGREKRVKVMDMSGSVKPREFLQYHALFIRKIHDEMSKEARRDEERRRK